MKKELLKNLKLKPKIQRSYNEKIQHGIDVSYIPEYFFERYSFKEVVSCNTCGDFAPRSADQESEFSFTPIDEIEMKESEEL